MDVLFKIFVICALMIFGGPATAGAQQVAGQGLTANTEISALRTRIDSGLTIVNAKIDVTQTQLEEFRIEVTNRLTQIATRIDQLASQVAANSSSISSLRSSVSSLRSSVTNISGGSSSSSSSPSTTSSSSSSGAASQSCGYHYGDWYDADGTRGASVCHKIGTDIQRRNCYDCEGRQATCGQCGGYCAYDKCR